MKHDNPAAPPSDNGFSIGPGAGITLSGFHFP
jgi:hypothetical protein